MLKAFGKSRSKRLRQRLDDLHAAQNLEVMKTLPGHLHALKGNREGQLSLDLDGPHRLIIESVVSEELEDADAVEWSDVTCVMIVEIADTHA